MSSAPASRACQHAHARHAPPLPAAGLPLARCLNRALSPWQHFKTPAAKAAAAPASTASKKRPLPIQEEAEPAAKTPAKKSAAAKKGGAKLDSDGNEMTFVYYVRQYAGLIFTLLSFAFIAFAGYATQYGFSSANTFLYPGCAIGFVGLALHELRPYKTKAQMTFDPAAVEYRKKEIAKAEKMAAKKGK